MIIKVRNKSGFAQIQNTTLRDKRLTLDARGALAEILTYSEEFKASTESLMSLWGIGREKLLKITNQLKKFGYLEIVPVRDSKGKIVDKDWIFFGEPKIEPVAEPAEKVVIHDAGNPYVGETHDAGKPYVGENHRTENPHDLLKQESSQKEKEKEIETRTECAGPVSPIIKTDYEKRIFDWLGDLRISPLEYPDWNLVIDFAFASGNPRHFIPPEIIPECYAALESAEGRKFRVTPKNVLSNIAAFWREKQAKSVRGSDGKPDWKKAIDECSNCDEKGMTIVGERRICRHSKEGK